MYIQLQTLTVHGSRRMTNVGTNTLTWWLGGTVGLGDVRRDLTMLLSTADWSLPLLTVLPT